MDTIQSEVFRFKLMDQLGRLINVSDDQQVAKHSRC